MTIKLPVCTCCGKTQYPVREICGECLSDDLKWMDIRAEGELLASVPLYHSLDEFFQDRLPWTIGSVRLEDGTVMMVNLGGEDMESGTEVSLSAEQDHKGRSVYWAHRKEEEND
ncbi:Zn-ribbon domain-containing OB-fold protein [Emcibacter sp.]|uniref:Zn-ribbon domain-containing OB-fold protein n=1 Tax=Emcibacter sp. TaxID=1979954 RepID=UPI002AA81340|nr:OB-fold domain-containing protein [Emcibacter sp.]